MSEPGPEPHPAPTKRQKWPWILGGLIVVVALFLVIGLTQPAPPLTATAHTSNPPVSTEPLPSVTSAAVPVQPMTTAATTATDDGAAGLLKSAGPLRAHLGGPDGSSVLCDTGTATASNSDGGVQVVMNFPGPANIQASILATNGQGQYLPYTESMQENGYVFNFSGFDMAKLQTLNVSVTSGAGGGVCWIVDNLN
jgi:hypothetical protein